MQAPRNINNVSLSSYLEETYSNLVIVSDTSGRQPQQVENPPYSLQLSHIYSWLSSGTLLLVHTLAKNFTPVGGENQSSNLLK